MKSITSPHNINGLHELGPNGPEILRRRDIGNGTAGRVLGRAKQETGPPQVLKHLVRDGHLGVSERLENFLITVGHLRQDVVEQEGEGFAPEFRHLVNRHF